jgi:plasmid replication initiation protein
MVNIERLTDVKNDIILDLLYNYRVEELRCLFLCINRIRTKNKFLDDSTLTGCFNGIPYTFEGEYIEENDRFEVVVPFTDFKNYAIRKNRKQDEILAIVNSIMDKKVCYETGSKRIFKNLIHTIEFDEVDKEFIVYFIKENFAYVMDLHNNFFTVDLEELIQLKGKYETGVYLIYWRWIQTGTAYYNMEQLRDYFSIGKSTPNYKVFQNLKIAIQNVNRKFGYDIKLSTKSRKRGSNDITDVTIFFTASGTKRKKGAWSSFPKTSSELKKGS